MKLVALLARYLLGLIFAVFGLNGFLHFLRQPPPANPLALQYFTAMGASHYTYMIFAFQLVAGLMLLSGYFVPLALTILAAELVNVLTFHLAMDPGGIGLGVVTTLLWTVVFVHFRASFAGLLAARPMPRS